MIASAAASYAEATKVVRRTQRPPSHRGETMRVALNVVGVLFLLVGCVWFLQGINVIQGSFMTGQPKWAIYGALTLLAGIVLLIAVKRRGSAP